LGGGGTRRQLSNSIRETQDPSFSFAHGSRVNLELSDLELTAELAARHDFEAADHLHVAHQLPFDLKLTSGDMGIDLGVRAHHQKITSLTFPGKAAVDLYWHSVTEFS